MAYPGDRVQYGNGGWKVVVVAALLIFMQILMVCGRLVSRSLKKVRLSNDDYMLLTGTVGLGTFSPTALAILKRKKKVLTFGLCAVAVACMLFPSSSIVVLLKS